MAYGNMTILEVKNYKRLWVSGYNESLRFYYKEKDAALPEYTEWDNKHEAWKQGWMTGLRICKKLSTKKQGV